MDAAVCVVIPFYQREPAPLVRALASIIRQEGVAPPRVLIVDDGSPCPASPIVRKHFPDHPDIRVIRQDNAGASRARNAGLAEVPAETGYLAFLDSDDTWSPDHLANALCVLGHGADMYFADHQRDDWPSSKFSMLAPPLGDHECLDPDRQLYLYTTDPLLPIFQQHLIQTSTVVLRWQVVKDLRFRVDLVLGEDEVFWIEAVRRSARVGFSRAVEASLGRGVNISQNAAGDSARELTLIAQNMLFWSHLPHYLPDEPGLSGLRGTRIRQLRDNYAALVLHGLARGRLPSLASLVRFTGNDPRWLLALTGLILRRLGG